MWPAKKIQFKNCCALISVILLIPRNTNKERRLFTLLKKQKLHGSLELGILFNSVAEYSKQRQVRAHECLVSHLWRATEAEGSSPYPPSFDAGLEG